MKRAEIQWTGSPVVGLSMSVLYFDDDKTDIRATLLSFITELGPILPDTVTLTHEPSGDVINPATGVLESVWSEAGGNAVVTGSGGNLAAAGVGGCITWLTAGIENGHRVRGRTFIVPLATGAYDANGTLAPTAHGRLQSAALILVTAGLVIWHRPTTPGGLDGSEHPVVNSSVRDRVAYLSSRRD